MLKESQITWLVWIAALLLTQHSWTQLYALELEQTVEPRIPVMVEPGHDAEFEIALRNDSDQPVSSAILRSAKTVIIELNTWNFQSLTPEHCSDIQFESGGASELLWEFAIEVTDIAPGELMICRYRVERDEHSTLDVLVDFEIFSPQGKQPPEGSVTYVMGSLADLNLSITPICSNDSMSGQRRVRVEIYNAGPSAVEDVGFGGCLPPGEFSFPVSGELEGGCSGAAGTRCPIPLWPSLSFMFEGSLMPGETQTCLLSINESLVNGSNFEAHMALDSSYLSGPLLVHEINPYTGQAVLSLATHQQTCDSARSVPFFPSGRWLGIVLLCWLILISAIRYKMHYNVKEP